MTSSIDPGQIGGAALMLLFLADIFLTVLYARAGTGLLAPYWDRAIWGLFRAAAGTSGRRRGIILSLAGPVIVVSLIGFWSLGLAVGAALVIQPELGTAIRASSGGTTTDFGTALLVAGNSLSIVGGGEHAPHTTGTRLLFLANSLIGASVLSLVLSYLVQVYSALRERNTLALTIDLMSDGTGDAAVLLARLMPAGEAGDATAELDNLARALAATKEAHHFYPLLFYFHFEEPRYAVSRFTFVLLDLTTLIGAALDRQRYRTLIDSAPVAALDRGALLLLRTIARTFPAAVRCRIPAAEEWRDRQSYDAAKATFADAGIALEPWGAGRYVAMRKRWEPLAGRMAPALGYAVDEIDRRSGQQRKAGRPA